MPTNAGAVPIKQRGIIFNHEVTEMDFNNLFKETHNVEAPENAYEHFCDVFCAEEENMKEFVVSKVADIIAEMDTDKADYAREWETVFDEPHTFGIYVGDQPDLKPLKNLTFYRTYGGGPEGGYVVSKEDLVWEVERNWMKPFAIMKFYHATVKTKSEDGLLYIKVIPDEEDEEECDRCHKRLHREGKAENVFMGICESQRHDCPCQHDDSAKDFHLCGECCDYNDDEGVMYCIDCKDHKEKGEEEEEEEEDGSVHTTCCVKCEKSFAFSEPVSMADYLANKHEQMCPDCIEKDACYACVRGKGDCSHSKAEEATDHAVARMEEPSFTADEMGRK